MNLLARAIGLTKKSQGSDPRTDRDSESSEPPVIVQATPAGADATTSSTNTWQGRPASLVDLFFGRDEALKAIARGFRKDRAVAISGPSGIGKTRLAAEFAHRSEAPGFWTTAGASLDETLAALAPALYLRIDGRTDSEIAVDVRRLLDAFPGTTVWVIDNLRDAAQAGQILAACGQVRPLITLKLDAGKLDPGKADADGKLPDEFTRVDLEPLKPGAALELLGARSSQNTQNAQNTQASGPADNPDAVDLVEYVSRLPVAVELLGGLISEGDSPADLLAELRKTVVDAPEGHDADDESGQWSHILAASAITLFRLPGPVLRQIGPLAFAGDAPMSKGMAGSLVSLEGDELLDMFRACSRRSLLTWHGESVRIHPAVTAAISSHSQAGGVGRSIKRAIGGKQGAGALETALRRSRRRLALSNRKPGADLRNDIAHYDQILAFARKKLDAQPDTHSELDGIRVEFVGELAVAYHTLGRANAAIALTEESLEAREESLGIDHPSTIAARNNLASVYQSAGRVGEAVAVHKKTLAEAERSLGPDHPTTLASRQNLATAHRAAGHVNEAVPLYEKAVKSQEQLLGPEHPDTLAGRNMLASAYQAAGQIHQAVPLYEKTLQLRARILGDDHPDTLTTRGNLATAYQSSGRLGDALELYEDALEARTRVFGAEDRGTLTVRNNLATAYQSDGRLSKAMKMYEETLDARTRTLGEEHIGTLTSRNNLASANRATGNLRDALMMYEQNIVDRTRILGPEHPKTLTSMNNAATVRSDIGNVEEAVPAFEEVLEVAERVLGKSHPISVTCTANLSAAYRVMGRYEDARRIEGDSEQDPDR